MKMRMRYKLTAPLSHIGETASTGSYFQTILTCWGKLPVITGNSIRGRIRDCGAKRLLDILGVKVDKDVFHLLFSGGNLSGSMKNDIEKALKVRQLFPIVSVLGGGLGDMILAGKMNLSFAYPVCQESEEITGIESPESWHKMIEEIEFTRTDDSKDDQLSKYIIDMDAETKAKASTQMRYSVQYFAAGAEFVQDITLINATPLEKGALISAIKEWFRLPVLGGMASKGFGCFTAQTEDKKIAISGGELFLDKEYEELSTAYESFVKENAIEICENMFLLKEGKKSGKKTSKSAKDNG